MERIGPVFVRRPGRLRLWPVKDERQAFGVLVKLEFIALRKEPQYLFGSLDMNISRGFQN